MKDYKLYVDSNRIVHYALKNMRIIKHGLYSKKKIVCPWCGAPEMDFKENGVEMASRGLSKMCNIGSFEIQTHISDTYKCHACGCEWEVEII